MNRLKWYWVTRSLGAGAFLFELLVDHGTDRPTIIIAAAGLMGVDKVARSEHK